MKIVLTCNSAWGAGGQGNFLERAANGLSAMPTADLTVYCAGHAKPQTPFPVHSLGYSPWRKPFISTPILRRRSDWLTLLNDRYFDQQVSKQLKTQQFDLIVGVAGQSDLSFRTAKAQRAKIWLYCLNAYLPFMQAQIKQEEKALDDPAVTSMNPQMLKRFINECEQADFILLNSEFAKQTFIEAGFAPEKLAVITPIVNPQRFYPAPKQDSIFRVLYVGTIHPRKGVHYLIPAFQRAEIPDAELLLVGGASTRTLRLLVNNVLKGNVNIKQEFWNFQKQDPTPVFSQSSVLVMPSVEDGFGVVALEAMASGLPVIVTSHSGAADVVEEGVNGFIVPPRTPEAIAEKLIFLAQNEALRLEMGKVARLTAEKHTQQRYNRDLKNIFIDQEMVKKSSLC